MRTRGDRGRPTPAVLLALVLILQLLGSPGAGAAQPEIAVVAAGVADGRARLTVNVPGAGTDPVAPGSFSVTVDGQPQPTAVTPLLSDRLAMGIVVDASEAGGPLLQAGLSGAANLVLTAPPGVRTAIVTDTAQPTVVASLARGQTEALRGLSSIQAAGTRETAAALDLAVQQLPAGGDDPRLVVLYTGAPAAQGLPAADLVERLAGAGVVLAAITTGDGRVPQYWSSVTTSTGGVAIGARAPEVIAAFDQLVPALRTRHLLTFPVPDRLPAEAVVRVETPSGLRTGAAIISVAPAASPKNGSGAGTLVGVVFGLTALVLITGWIAVRGQRRRKSHARAPRHGGGSSRQLGRRGHRRRGYRGDVADGGTER